MMTFSEWLNNNQPSPEEIITYRSPDKVMPPPKKMVVSPNEYKYIQNLELHDISEYDKYLLVKVLLGDRCPEPYTGPHNVMVDWSL